MIIIALIGIVLHSYIFLSQGNYITELVISFLPYIIAIDLIIVLWGFFKIISKKESNTRIGYSFIILLYLGCIYYYTHLFVINYSYSTTPAPTTNKSISFLYGNIYYKNNNFSGLLSTIQTHNPDIIMFVEYAKIHDDALSDILDKEYPYKNRYVGGKHFDGDIILSRYPIKKIEHQTLPGSRSFTHVRLKKENVPLDIALIHTSAPVSSELFDQRNQQMDKLIEILGEYYTGENNISDRNLIVLGDFNISPRSPYYTRFNTHANNIGLYNISSNLQNTVYNELFPYTRCHSKIIISCSHIDHIRSNNTGLYLQHVQIPGSDHDGFVGSFFQ